MCSRAGKQKKVNHINWCKHFVNCFYFAHVPQIHFECVSNFVCSLKQWKLFSFYSATWTKTNTAKFSLQLHTYTLKYHDFHLLFFYYYVNKNSEEKFRNFKRQNLKNLNANKRKQKKLQFWFYVCYPKQNDNKQWHK